MNIAVGIALLFIGGELFRFLDSLKQLLNRKKETVTEFPLLIIRMLLIVGIAYIVI